MSDTRDRLLKGARLIGDLYLGGKASICRLFLGCSCEALELWCRAKTLWVSLFLDEKREGFGVEEYQLVTSMSLAEFEASKLTLVLEIPEVGTVRVGPKGIPVDTFLEIDKDTLQALLKVVQSFPGSTVVA